MIVVVPRKLTKSPLVTGSHCGALTCAYSRRIYFPSSKIVVASHMYVQSYLLISVAVFQINDHRGIHLRHQKSSLQCDSFFSFSQFPTALTLPLYNIICSTDGLYFASQINFDVPPSLPFLSFTNIESWRRPSFRRFFIADHTPEVCTKRQNTVS